MAHYNEYQELLEEFSPEELKTAYFALGNSILQEELYERESPLLVFLIDTEKQEQLYLWIEDQERINEF